MPSVDNRIVRMEFDNSAFERKVQSTLVSLAQLEHAMKLEGAGKGFQDLNAAAGKVDLSHISKGISDVTTAANHVSLSHISSAIDGISRKFSAMGAAAFTAIQSITNAGINFAVKTGGDFLGPVISGGKKRAVNIENAKFQFQGLGINVEKAMASSLKAVKGTAFGLDEAAKAAAQFGASGIDAGDQMTRALRGIAGAAAMTNTSFSEMADIFTSSAGSGVVNNQDLGQFATRGLNAAAAVGKVMHKTEAQIHAMASAGKLDFKTFADAMDKAFGAHATEANKTYTGALANLHAAMSRLGAALIGPRLEQERTIFNNLSDVVDRLTTALKPLFNTILGISQMLTNKLNKNLKKIDFKHLTEAIPHITAGLLNIFDAFGRIYEVGKKAFRDIFPKSTTSTLVIIAAAFHIFSERLKAGTKTIAQFRRIFGGFFAALSIGWTVLKEGVKLIYGFVKSLISLGGSGALEFFAKIGDRLKNLQKDLVKGGKIKDFFADLRVKLADFAATLQDVFGKIQDFASKLKVVFDKIVVILKSPLSTVDKIKAIWHELFSGFDSAASDKVNTGLGVVNQGLGRLHDRFKSVKAIFSSGGVFQPFIDELKKIGSILAEAGAVIGDWFKDLGKKIAATMNKGDFNNVFDALNTILLAGIGGVLVLFFKKGLKVDLTGGLADKLTGVFDAMTNKLKAMQLQIKAEVLMKIAEAIALLTASVLVLSLIDSVALTKALTAMSVGFAQLLGAFAILNQTQGMSLKKGGTFDLLAAGLILLAAAILVLSISLKIIATIGWKDLAKGLLTFKFVIEGLMAIVEPMSKNSEGMIAAGAAILVLASAMVVLSLAMKIFATMSWQDIIKGLAGVAGGLIAIGFSMDAMPPAGLFFEDAAAMVAIGVAMFILAKALQEMAKISWGDIAKGLVTIVAVIAALSLASEEAPALPIFAAGLLIAAFALVILAKAMQMMGGMSWGEIAKGLAAIAGALLVLAVGLTAMIIALPGALALVVAAHGLAALAVVIKLFSDMSWSDLLRGLGGIGIALVGIAVVSSALMPAVAAIFLLGVALMSLGAGFALIGLGAFLLAKAFEAIAGAGEKGVKTLIAIIDGLVKEIPKIGVAFVQTLIDSALAIAKAAPTLAKALGVLLLHIADTMIKLMPKLFKMIEMVIDEFNRLVYKKGPRFIAAGIFILKTLLQGISNNIEDITTKVSDIIIKFLNALTKKMPEIINAGVNLLIAFLKGIGDNLDKIMDTVTNLIVRFIFELGSHELEIINVGFTVLKQFLKGITNNLIEVVTTVATLISKFIEEVGKNALRVVKAGIDTLIAFLTGLATYVVEYVEKVATLITNLITEIGKNGLRIIKAGIDATTTFLTGVATYTTDFVTKIATLITNFITEIGKNSLKIVKAGMDATIAFLTGVATNTVEFVRKCADLIINFNNALRQVIDEKSPELEESGRLLLGAILNGLLLGIPKKGSSFFLPFVQLGKDILGTIKDSPLNIIGDPYSLALMHVGEALGKGLGMGLDNDTTAEKAAANFGLRTVSAMNSVLSEAATSLNDMEEFNPTITPVLDLTRVAADAAKISAFIPSSTLIPTLNQARIISADTNSIKSVGVSESTATTGNVNFHQIINAPKELSTADIYKQTRNQIAMAKEELKIP